MTQIKFIHAADIHLDSPLNGLSTDDEVAAEQIRLATRHALENLVTEATDRAVDFMLIAGDLYDGDWRDYRTGLCFTRQMARLKSAEIPVFVIQGNHDAESKMTRHLKLPENVHLFGSKKPSTKTLDDLGVAIHGYSYKTRDVTENLVPHYPAPVPGMFNVALLHTALNGRAGHANYAPCTLAELQNKGYDYWALGHVHAYELLSEAPHVVFPGNLQGRSIRETGPKQALEVVVEDGRVVDTTSLYCDVVRWAVVDVPIDDCDRLNQVYDAISEAVQSAVAQHAEGRLLAMRIRLVGTSALQGDLTARGTELIAQARNAAQSLGAGVAYVEKLVVATEPSVTAEAMRAREDALGELRRLMDGAVDDPELVKMLDDDIGALVRGLPADVQAQVEEPILQAAIDGETATMLQGASDYLMGRLTAHGDR
ncbi:metallophosphoesterase [Salinisphaera dokdonensis CL-ES53]|uniref:Metallophosphoesterase n=1 Tax=Salinisphaera dokdonensis CL-ES53 TaxID=1304272 RepID=A0ABV2AYY2_9GAMM